MPTLLDHRVGGPVHKKEPRYPTRFRELIDNRTADPALAPTGVRYLGGD